MVGCIEEIAFSKGFIGKEQLAAAAKRQEKSEYGKYLSKLLEETGHRI